MRNKYNATYEITGAQTNKICNRGTAYERSAEKKNYLGRVGEEGRGRSGGGGGGSGGEGLKPGLLTPTQEPNRINLESPFYATKRAFVVISDFHLTICS